MAPYASEASDAPPFFSVEGLSVRYGGVTALHSVSIAVAAGSITAIIGANGAGKSTLLRTISGLVRPHAGQIRLDGARIDRLPPDRIVAAGIAHVQEGRRLFPEMTVLENLRMGAYLRKDRTDRDRDIEQMYGHFPVLRDRLRMRAGSLSGGEQQMLAIARGLMAKPRLLLMDEPSIGLSPLMLIEIGRIVRRINSELKVTVVLVEQNALMALGLASYAYVIQTGTILREGLPAELLNDAELRMAYLGV